MSWQNPEFRVGNNERPGQEKLLDPKMGATCYSCVSFNINVNNKIVENC